MGQENEEIITSERSVSLDKDKEIFNQVKLNYAFYTRVEYIIYFIYSKTSMLTPEEDRKKGYTLRSFKM